MTSSILIDLEGVGPVLLERSTRAKHLNITVKPFTGVRVAVPNGTSLQTAERITRSKSKWLKTHVGRVKELEKQYRNSSGNTAAVNPEKVREILTARLAEIAAEHGYSYDRVTIRNQKTRWGSCSGRNNISLNVKLMLLPERLRDYILLHELVHTRIKNHGPEFWAEMLRVEPRARELSRQLRQVIIPYP